MSWSLILQFISRSQALLLYGLKALCLFLAALPTILKAAFFIGKVVQKKEDQGEKK